MPGMQGAVSTFLWNVLDSGSDFKSSLSVFSQLVLEDSDVDILSDITVSSVHTSDLSSFEEDSEDMLSDSTEEGEIVSDGKVILTFG